MLQVISGGQTGADAIGLEIARELGFATGGVAPKGYHTEIGPNPYLRTVFGLEECADPGYTVRTKLNVQRADLTVLFGDVNSPGSRQTIRFCQAMNKPYLCNPTGQVLAANLMLLHAKVLNVAGNRGSKFSEARRGIMRDVLVYALQHVRDHCRKELA